jgi:hypothetical protein
LQGRQKISTAVEKTAKARKQEKPPKQNFAFMEKLVS